MASEPGPMTVTITSDGAVCNMGHASYIAALRAENAKLRETVKRLKAPISDYEWRTYRDRTWIGSMAPFNAIIAARSKETK